MLNKNIDLLVIDLARGINKPPKFDNNALQKAHFKLTASETSFLIEYFGILVGAHVPEECEFWELYILLREIYFLIMAPSFTEGSPELLRNLTKQHSLLFRELNLTKKSRARELLGPLRYAALIRGEAVYSKFKRYAVVARS